MSSLRPSDQRPSEPRRTVDEDGVVRIDLRPAGGAKRSRGFLYVYVVASTALLGAAGVLAWGALNGAPGSGGSSRIESNGRAQALDPRSNTAGARPNTTRNRSPNGPAPSPAGGAALAEARGNGETGQSPSPRAIEPAAAAVDDGHDGDDEMGAEASASDSPERAGGPERTGLSAFPAPGTKRIKRGLVVPEDFPLPAGYVRHYQATDKGQLLQPILMFHPDYTPLDASGSPIPLPADRVVPEAMAPPGLAAEYIDIPDDAYADRESWGSEGGGEPEEGDGDSAP